MDDQSTGGLRISAEEVQRLTPGDQRGLQEFLQNEGQKQQVQAVVHQLTELCFKKCITSVSGGKLAGKEETCVENCVGRFFDSNLAVLKHLEQLRYSQ